MPLPTTCRCHGTVFASLLRGLDRFQASSRAEGRLAIEAWTAAPRMDGRRCVQRAAPDRRHAPTRTTQKMGKPEPFCNAPAAGAPQKHAQEDSLAWRTAAVPFLAANAAARSR